MAKKIETKETQDTQTIIGSAPPEFTHSALSIVKKPGLHNSVIKIQFNPETGEVGSVEVIKADCNKTEAEEIFKINVAREIFMKG